MGGLRAAAVALPLAASIGLALLDIRPSWEPRTSSSNEVDIIREPPAARAGVAAAELPEASLAPAPPPERGTSGRDASEALRPSVPEAALREVRPIQVPFLTIDGSAVPKHRADATWAVGPNLIINGDFSQGDALWAVRDWTDFQLAPARTVSHQISGGALCLTMRAGEHHAAAWPSGAEGPTAKSFELVAGRRYRLSLTAWASGDLPVQVVARVGHQLDWRDQTVVARVAVSGERQSFVVDFEPEETDAGFGVGWIASTADGEGQAQVCVDDVALVERQSKPEPRSPPRPPATPAPAPPAAPRPKDDCRHPYWTDPEGNRRLKPGCL